MTFLEPLSAILAGLVAVPALVLLYLLKLRRRTLRVSSTLLWDQTVKDLHANEPFRWLRPSLLLFLQLLALLCLLVALARPVIGGGDELADRVVIILDRSASMSATDGAGSRAGSSPAPSESLRPLTRWDEASQAALRVVERIERSGGRARRPAGMVIGAAHDARAVTGFTSDVRELRDAINAMTPTDQPLNLDAAARLVGAMAARPDGGDTRGDEADRERGSVSAVLISDGGFDPGALVERSGASKSGVRWSFVPVGPAGARGGGRGDAGHLPALSNNCGIVAMSARRESADPGTARVFVRVLNGSASEVKTTLTCRLDAGEAQTVALDIPAATAEPGSAGVKAGETTASFDVRRAGRGVVSVEIGRGDVLSADNLAAVVIEPLRRPRVLVVCPSSGGSAADPGLDRSRQADVFLMGALEAADSGGLRVIDLTTYERSDEWGAYDLIVFDRVTPRRMPERPSLSFAGGLAGVVAVGDPGAGGKDSVERTRAVSWKRTHPVMRDVRLDTLVVYPALIIKAPDEGQTVEIASDPSRGIGARAASGEALALGSGSFDAGESGERPSDSAGRTLIEAIEASPAPGSQGRGGRRTRHLVVGFALERSNWGPSETFPIFIANAMEWLLGEGFSGAGLAATTGSSAWVRVPAGTVATAVELTGPRQIGVPVEPGNERVELGVLERAGLYGVRFAGTPSEGESGGGFLAVNLQDAGETLCVSRGADLIELPRVMAREGADGEGSAGAAETDEAKRGAGGREAWPWLVMAAGVLLCVEWIVYAWRSRA